MKKKGKAGHTPYLPSPVTFSRRRVLPDDLLGSRSRVPRGSHETRGSHEPFGATVPFTVLRCRLPIVWRAERVALVCWTAAALTEVLGLRGGAALKPNSATSLPVPYWLSTQALRALRMARASLRAARA